MDEIPNRYRVKDKEGKDTGQITPDGKLWLEKRGLEEGRDGKVQPRKEAPKKAPAPPPAPSRARATEEEDA